MLVVKKNNQVEEFDKGKIIKAICLASGRSVEKLNYSEIVKISDCVEQEVSKLFTFSVPIAFLHECVISEIKRESEEVANEYAKYRDYKKRFNKTFLKIAEGTHSILHEGDNENANKDSNLISTQKELISGVVSKQMVLDNEITEEWAEAHRKGFIQIHDLTDYLFNSINCCLFDIGAVLKDGFEANGIKKREPNSIRSAISIASDVLLSASSQQFGGFTYPQIDTMLAPYVERSRVKYRAKYRELFKGQSEADIDRAVESSIWEDLVQGFEAEEDRRNTTNNSNGQTSFTTFSFGLDTSEDGRLISKAILEVRERGLGEHKVTAIFPKLVFLCRKEINGLESSPNYDLYEMAIRVSLKRAYPDYLSLDIGYLAEMYEKYGAVVSPMGCRAFLSPWFKRGGMYPADEMDEPVFIGRANCGAVSLNLPRIAIESAKGCVRGSIEHFAKFRELVDYYVDMGIQLHLYKFAKLRKQKASSNPLFFTQGGCHIKLHPQDTIEEAIKTFTWSIGYIGLEEVNQYMMFTGLAQDSDFAVDLLERISSKLEKAKKEHELMFALYSTPAESMCYRFLKLDREEYGVIEGVTDKEYYTNSYHIPVREKISALDKQDKEARMFHIAKGGRIVYNEFPITKNFHAIKQCIDYAMSLGLYYGVNIQMDFCYDCGQADEFKEMKCNKCGSTNILRINRVCGYLSFADRQNFGKENEVKERVDHFDFEVKEDEI